MQPAIGPTWTLTLTAAVVIAGCAALVSLSLSCLAIAWDPCALIGGVLLLPIPVFLGVEQYRGAFRGSARAAVNAGVLLFVAAGFTGFGVVVSVGEAMYARSAPVGRVAGMLASASALAAFCAFAGQVNLRRSRLLRRANALVAEADSHEPAPPDRRTWQFSLRELLGLAAVVALVAGLTTYFVRTTGPQYAEHVSPREAPFYVPPGASDVCYCRGPRGSIAYEFTIDEQGFRTWVLDRVAGREGEVDEECIQPVDWADDVIRYTVFSAQLSGPRSATVIRGCHYSWRKGDACVHAVFDRDAQRAYYFASFH